MLAVENCDVGIVESTLPKFQEDHEQRVFLAVINEPSQSIFSGKLSELKAFEVFIHSLYPVKTRFLNIAVPSHCRLMDSVSALLKSDLETIHIKNPQIPYVSNYAAHRGRRAELVRDDFVYGVSHTVHWYDGITLLKECGATDFVEIGGSSILTDIGRRCYAELNWKIDT
jgi:malonate decarboxylase epsilon subunit